MRNETAHDRRRQNNALDIIAAAIPAPRMVVRMDPNDYPGIDDIGDCLFDGAVIPTPEAAATGFDLMAFATMRLLEIKTYMGPLERSNTMTDAAKIMNLHEAFLDTGIPTLLVAAYPTLPRGYDIGEMLFFDIEAVHAGWVDGDIRWAARSGRKDYVPGKREDDPVVFIPHTDRYLTARWKRGANGGGPCGASSQVAALSAQDGAWFSHDNGPVTPASTATGLPALPYRGKYLPDRRPFGERANPYEPKAPRWSRSLAI